MNTNNAASPGLFLVVVLTILAIGLVVFLVFNLMSASEDDDAGSPIIPIPTIEPSIVPEAEYPPGSGRTLNARLLGLSPKPRSAI